MFEKAPLFLLQTPISIKKSILWPLIFSVHSGCMVAMDAKVLLLQPVLKEQPFSLGMPALHQAAKKGDVATCIKILETDSEEFDQIHGGMTVLHYAAMGGHTKVANLIITRNRTILNVQDSFGNTALHLAVKNSGKKRATVSEDRKDVALALRYGELVALLIENGAALQVRNFKGHLAIDGAIRRCNIKIIDLLMQSASSEEWKNMVYRHMIFWMPSSQEEKPSHESHRSLSFFRKMSKAASPKVEAHLDYQDLKMLLYCAGLYNCPHLCRLLVQDMGLIKKTEEEFEQSRLVDRKLKMLLHIAAELGYRDILVLLLPFYKADDPRNLFYHLGFTPLHCACVGGNIGIVTLLCDHKTPIDVKDFVGYTPLHRASQEGHVHIVEALLDRGANMSETAEKLTTLHIAATKGRAPVVRLLMQRGADPKRTSESTISFLQIAAETTAKLSGLISGIGAMAMTAHRQREKKITPLHCAAFSGSLETIRCLLNEANVKDNDGNIALHYAIRSGSAEAIRVLASVEEINTSNNAGITPLHLACALGLYPVIKLLLELGADVHKTDSRGFLPMHFICASSKAINDSDELSGDEISDEDEIVVQKVGHEGMKKVSPYKKNSIVNEFNQIVTNSASDALLIEIIDTMIKDDAANDLNAVTADAWTPLLLAVSVGNKELAHMLIGRGAKLDGTTNGYPVLHWALRQGSSKCAKIVETIVNLNDTYEVNLIESSYKTECLEWGEGRSRGRMRSHTGHLAADADSHIVLSTLLELGVDVNLRDRDGWTILHRAVNKGSSMVVHLLLQYNADIFTRSNDGYVPLHLAAKIGNLDIMKKLLSVENADANVVSKSASFAHIDKTVALPEEVSNSKSGYTPLHLLTQFGSDQAEVILGIDLLKKHGANINCKTFMGVTPLHFASRNGHELVVAKLIELGADFSARDNSGNTPLDDAVNNGHQTVVEVLKKFLEKAHSNE